MKWWKFTMYFAIASKYFDVKSCLNTQGLPGVNMRQEYKNIREQNEM